METDVPVKPKKEFSLSDPDPGSAGDYMIRAKDFMLSTWGILGILFVVSLFLLPLLFNALNNGPERSDWAFEMTQIENLYDDGYKGEGVVVGLIDTGIDPNHDDLDHIEIVAWRDYINDRNDPYDDQGHGTMVAGILAARGDLRGAAPKVSMVVAKVFDVSGGTSRTEMEDIIAEAVDFCVENGADIISMSLGGTDFMNYNEIPSDRTEDACRRALNQGVFVVAAAGNDGDDVALGETEADVASPGTVDDVICVGSIDKNGIIAPTSSVGDNNGWLPGPFDDRRDPDRKPELVAPGVDIFTTYPGNKYKFMSGTSAATPFVSGALALLLEAHPEYKRDGASGGDRSAIDHVKTLLMNTAREQEGQGTPHDDYYGYGLVKIKDTIAGL